MKQGSSFGKYLLLDLSQDGIFLGDVRGEVVQLGEFKKWVTDLVSEASLYGASLEKFRPLPMSPSK